MDSDVVRALLTGLVWLVIVIVVRTFLNSAFNRYERRLAESDPAVAARRRTTFGFLLRVVVALVVFIGVWSVLSIFPATSQVASAFLGSAAVLAVIAGLALSTPLGNLGSGVLLAFTQPVRLGDRITIEDFTGVVDEISLSYTALTTDEGRRIFVPNTKMVSTVIVNRSVDDPRRLVVVDVPVRLGRLARRGSPPRDGGCLERASGRRARDLRADRGHLGEDRAATRRRIRTVQRRRAARRERDPGAGP